MGRKEKGRKYEKKKKIKEKGSEKLVKKFCLGHTGGENSTKNFFGGGKEIKLS